MQSMLRIFALGIVLLIFLPAIGFAQGGQPPLHLDHLKCYMVKDPKMVKADVNLFSLQFDIDEDCKIIGKERFFCGGVDKTVVGEDPSGFPIFPDAPDRICYRIECPPGQGQNDVPPDTEVEDQFGKRTLTKFNPHYLCTPAFKTGQLCEERAVCGGTCVSDDFPDEPATCRGVGLSNGDCRCLPPDIECPDVTEQFCPQQQVCRRDGVSGKCFPEFGRCGCFCNGLPC